MSYRPVLTVRAAAQFADLSRLQEIREAFMDNWSTRRGTRVWYSLEAASPSFARPCSVTRACWLSGWTRKRS